MGMALMKEVSMARNYERMGIRDLRELARARELDDIFWHRGLEHGLREELPHIIEVWDDGLHRDAGVIAVVEAADGGADRVEPRVELVLGCGLGAA